MMGLSMALGPLLGGVLVQTIGWQAIFWLNVPIVLAALVLSTIFVPESRTDHPRDLDAVGQLLVMACLASLVYAIIEGRTLGWTSATVLGCLTGSAVALVLLLLVERRLDQPLIDPRFFASIPFSGAVISALLAFSAMAGFLFVNTLYLQGDRGMPPIQAGLMMLPMAACTGILAPVSGRLVGSIGPRWPLLLAGVCVAASALILTTLRSSTSVPTLLAAYVLFGCGNGLLNAPITNSAVSGMPRSQAGVAAAVASTSRQVGSALGIAIFGTLTFGGLGASGLSSLGEASRPAWWTMLGCGLGLVVVALVVTTGSAAASSARVEAQMSIES